MKILLTFFVLTLSAQAGANFRVSFFEDLNPGEHKGVYILGDDKIIVSRGKGNHLKVKAFLGEATFEFEDFFDDIEEYVDVSEHILSRSVTDREKFKLRIPFGSPRKIKMAGKEMLQRDFVYFIFDIDGVIKKEIFYWPEPQ